VRPDIIVDHAYSDDAAIVKSGGPRDLVLTADVIAPLVDDPAAFGAIAATNSLSDVWAMGGEPRFALNLVFFPDDQLPLAILDEILAGGAKKCAEAGVAVVGGHSVRDAEVKFGLSVTGDVGPGELWANTTAEAGQALVLTKAIGTGIIGQAIKKGVASPEAAAAAIASMTTLNQGAARAGHAYGVTAATDVTGFGLLGHALEMCRGAGLAAEIAAEPPLLATVEGLARAGVRTGASARNWASYGAAVRLPDGLPDWRRDLLTDPQTSGGLLIAVAEANAGAVLALVRSRGFDAAAVVGRLVAGVPEVRVQG